MKIICLAIIQTSHDTFQPLPYRTVRYRTVRYRAVPYRTVPYRIVQTTYGQRKYMSQVGIELASPYHNTTNRKKVHAYREFQGKVSKWRTRYFGPNLSRTTISILESRYFGVEYQAKISCEVWFFVTFVRILILWGKLSRKSIMWSLVLHVIKRLALCSHDPSGTTFLSKQLLIEPRHLRSDDSRSGDLYAIAWGRHAKDVAINIMVTSGLSKSCLLHTSTSSDYALKLAGTKKSTTNVRSPIPLQLSSTQRFIPW